MSATGRSGGGIWAAHGAPLDNCVKYARAPVSDANSVGKSPVNCAGLADSGSGEHHVCLQASTSDTE